MLDKILELWVDMSSDRRFIRMSYKEKLEIIASEMMITVDDVKRVVTTDEFLDKVYDMAMVIDQSKIADAVSRQHQLLDSRVEMVGLEASKEIINRQLDERAAKAGKDKQSISDKLTDLLNDLK